MVVIGQSDAVVIHAANMPAPAVQLKRMESFLSHSTQYGGGTGRTHQEVKLRTPGRRLFNPNSDTATTRSSMKLRPARAPLSQASNPEFSDPSIRESWPRYSYSQPASFSSCVSPSCLSPLYPLRSKGPRVNAFKRFLTLHEAVVLDATSNTPLDLKLGSRRIRPRCARSLFCNRWILTLASYRLTAEPSHPPSVLHYRSVPNVQQM